MSIIVREKAVGKGRGKKKSESTCSYGKQLGAAGSPTAVLLPKHCISVLVCYASQRGGENTEEYTELKSDTEKSRRAA